MKRLLVVSIALLISAAFANPNQNQESPLLPGTKLIAGDPTKNEFFIVAENSLPATETKKMNIQTIINKTKTLPVQVASKAPIPQYPLSKKKPAVQLAAHSTNAVLAMNVKKKASPPLQQIHQVQKRPTVHLAQHTKKTVPQLKLALTQVLSKRIEQKLKNPIHVAMGKKLLQNKHKMVKVAIHSPRKHIVKRRIWTLESLSKHVHRIHHSRRPAKVAYKKGRGTKVANKRVRHTYS